jgi:uncharacterized repeat protein (TIGR03943 family)
VKANRFLVGLLALTVLRLTITGKHTQYVREALGPWLLLSGAVLLLLLVAGFVLDGSAPRPSEDRASVHSPYDHELSAAPGQAQTVLHNDHNLENNQENNQYESDQHEQGDHDHSGGQQLGHTHGHDHGTTPRVAWLLLAPVAVAFIVAPPALGSWGLNKSSNAAVAATRGANFAPLPVGKDHQMPTTEFVARAFDAKGVALKDRSVTIEAFVVNQVGNEITVARYSIACCAADGLAAQVAIRISKNPSSGSVIADNAYRNVANNQGAYWLRATGTFGGMTPDEKPILLATSVTPIPPPPNAYEE